MNSLQWMRLAGGNRYNATINETHDIGVFELSSGLGKRGMEMGRGSIALARSLCYEIAGPTGEDDDTTGSEYGSVDIAEILSAEVVRLRILLTRNLLGHPPHTIALIVDEVFGRTPNATLNEAHDEM